MNQLIGNTFFVDNSSIEPITTCPWLAYISIVRRLKRTGESPPLRFGGHIHAALAYRYRRIAQGHKPDDDVISRILTLRFARTPCENEDWRNVNMAHAVLDAYGIHYLEEETNMEVYMHKGYPLVEKPFSLYIGDVLGFKIVYMGRIDLVYKEGPHTYVIDHKTTSMMGITYWQDTAMSEQQRGYCWAVREVTGLEPLGYVINALACRKPTKTGTSIEFKRQNTFTREPAGQLDEWRENMLYQVEEFLWHHKRGIYPRHHKHCITKYGACPLYSVCELPLQSRELALQSSEFAHNDWTPLYK